MSDKHYISTSRIRYTEVPTFIDVDGGCTGKAKYTGRIVSVSRGSWDEERQDNRAVVTFSTGEHVETAMLYREFEAVPLEALAGREVTIGGCK